MGHQKAGKVELTIVFLLWSILQYAIENYVADPSEIHLQNISRASLDSETEVTKTVHMCSRKTTDMSNRKIYNVWSHLKQIWRTVPSFELKDEKKLDFSEK